MNNSLVPSGGLLPSRIDRQVSRALEQIDAQQLVAMHRDQARLDRVAGTAERGMVRAAQIGALEAGLVQMTPNAAAYVHASAVGGAIGIAGVVHDAGTGRVMWGLLLIGLFIELWELVRDLWPLLLAAFGLYLIWRWVVRPAWEVRAREVRDCLRHERARREIDRIALEASRAMYVASSNGDVIEGTAVELEVRRD